MALIRMSGHKLNLETGRYGSRTGSRHHRICEFCSEKSMMELFVNLPCVDPIIEDEEHFLRTCPRYHSSRTNMKDPHCNIDLLFVNLVNLVYIFVTILLTPRHQLKHGFPQKS